MNAPARARAARAIAVDDGETFDDFMSRCVDDEGYDPDECQLVWDERAGGKTVLRKTNAAKADGLDFVLSDETPDRYGEVIAADGWQLENFNKNPIALFGHDSHFPIGKWQNLHVEKGALRGHLQIAPAGTSDRIDEIRKLVEAGILKAVSVGFRPLKKEPIDERADSLFGPFRYLKHELVETSLVSIPANPNALAIAKSLKVSDDTLRMVFAKHGDKDTARADRRNGKHAEIPGKRKTNPMTMLAQRIVDGQKHLTDLKDTLQAHLDSPAGDNADEQLEKTNALNAEISQTVRTLEALRESEKNLGETSDGGGRSALPAKTTNGGGGSPRPFNLAPRKQLSPIDLLVRQGVVKYMAHAMRQSLDETRRAIYGEDEATRALIDYAQRAATAPATTTTTGWAAELVQTLYADFMQRLQPKAVYPRLSGKGLALTFGRAGKISIPTRSQTPTIAGSFVGEGLPIPVRQGAFTSQILTPKKMAVITTWTREIDEHSVPAIEGLLRDAISDDTAVSLDAVLLDVNPATTIRPAGILNGVAALTPTAGGGFTALVGDIKQVSGALLTATKGNVRAPAWLMNPQQVMSAGLTPAPGAGVFPFQEQVNGGNLQGWPIIDSGSVPLGRVIAIDCADFVSVGGEAPRFEISDQATLHMEDTTPLDIGTPGAPATIAAPVKSMWQTDSLALRLILPVNWTIRRAGVVAWVDGVTW
jgi:HK97 family phage prohead protease/HK97 family phage major capsid protein